MNYLHKNKQNIQNIKVEIMAKIAEKQQINSENINKKSNKAKTRHFSLKISFIDQSTNKVLKTIDYHYLPGIFA